MRIDKQRGGAGNDREEQLAETGVWYWLLDLIGSSTLSAMVLGALWALVCWCVSIRGRIRHAVNVGQADTFARSRNN